MLLLVTCICSVILGTLCRRYVHISVLLHSRQHQNHDMPMDKLEKFSNSFLAKGNFSLLQFGCLGFVETRFPSMVVCKVDRGRGSLS